MENEQSSSSAIKENNSISSNQATNSKLHGKNQQKTSRQYREIYRPPSLRSKSGRNINSSVGGGQGRNGKSNNNNKQPSNGTTNINSNTSSIPNNARQQQFQQQFVGVNNSGGPQQSHDFMMNPKDFSQFTSQQQQQQLQNQQLLKLIQLDPKLYGQVLANNFQGLYSLQQSKSLGNNLNLLLQQNHHQQLNAFAYLQQNQLPMQTTNFAVSSPSQFNRLTQSKSSGNIPDNLSKPRVRFELEESDGDDNTEKATGNMMKNAESKFSQLNLGQKLQQNSNVQGILQKSKTGFSLNFSQTSINQNVPQELKRSRSFGSGQKGKYSFSSTVFSDFQISKWPKEVQSQVTAAVTAVDRVAARQQIEMVNMIFEAMLRSNIQESGESSSDLSTPAVHIFLYFIQREKDRTVMESLLNTCFATFQTLFCGDLNNSDLLIPTKAGTFLRFLSVLYSQVKLLRRQKQWSRLMDEMSFSVLSLLCDSCLALIRSRLSNNPDLMDCLFTVMTSMGRDMEGTFPLKMKQLLAAVRDALLGLGPYSHGPLCSSVQKSLMQLIELHAANYSLPANAVRYYYSNNAKNN